MATDRPAEHKKKFALRMALETQQLVVSLYERDNCRSQNEFIEKAIRFYAGYLCTNDASEFLSHALLTVIRGILRRGEDRTNSNLFRIAVEMGLMGGVLAVREAAPPEELARKRGEIVDTLKHMRGLMRYEDLVREQTGL